MKKIVGVLRNSWWIVIGPFTITFIFFLICLIKGIFPFGNNSLCYFDANQVIVPYYYHGYDFLHGLNDLFLNWNVGLGSSMAEQSGYAVFFPTNLLFLLIGRNDIYDFMTFFVVIKLALASLFMTLYAYKKTSNKVLSIITSVMYSASGFAIQYYETIIYLDWLFLFPILVFSYEKLINENKKLLYIICLFLSFLCHQDMIIFVCLYLLLRTGVEMTRFEKKEKRVILSRVFICSVCAVLCSCFSFLPVLFQTFKSSRLSSDIHSGFFVAMQSIFCEYQQQKNFMLYGVEFVLPLVLVLILRKKIKKYYRNLVMILLLIIPVFFEGVNMMWHLGDYKLFPMRFGFILVFECINLLLDSYKDLQIDLKEIKGIRYLECFSICIFPLFAVVLYYFVKPFKVFGIRDCQLYLSYWVIVLLLCVIYVGIFANGFRVTKLYLVMMVVLAQAFLGFYGFVGPEMEYLPECEPSIIYNSKKIAEETKDLNRLYDRTKDLNCYLNANYPFITQTASVSGWANGTSSELVTELVHMGYDSFYVRSLDCGGTALTDSLFGYKYVVINSEDYNPDLYLPTDKSGNIYKYKYDIPFGVLSTNKGFSSKTYGFQHQNEIYRFLLDSSDDLFVCIPEEDGKIEYDETENNYIMDYSLVLDEPSIVYAYGSPDYESSYQIYVDENTIKVPILDYYENTYFPDVYRNGFLEMGTYSGEVSIKIIGTAYIPGDIQIGFIPISKLNNAITSLKEKYSLEDFTVKNSSLEMTISSSEGGNFIVPIAFSDNWRVYLNGKKIDTKGEINDSLLSVDLSAGRNTLTFKYLQTGFLPGLICSVIGVGLLIVLLKFNISVNDYINRVLELFYYLLMIVLVVFIYVDPISLNIYEMIRSKTNMIEVLKYFIYYI